MFLIDVKSKCSENVIELMQLESILCTNQCYFKLDNTICY